GEWAPISTLVELALQSRAFRRPDGLPLRNLRQIIHRVVKRLEEKGEVEISEERGTRGTILLVRKHPAATVTAGEKERNSVTPPPTRESDDITAIFAIETVEKDLSALPKKEGMRTHPSSPIPTERKAA